MLRFCTTPFQKIIKRSVIGQGSFGKVLEAEHRDWGIVAYKQLSTGHFIDDGTFNKMLKEVHAHHQLKHRNVVQMMAIVFEQNVEMGIVLGYEKFGNARNFIEKFDVPWPWRVNMVHDITLGLSYLHSLNPPIIHGDLKVVNVLVGDEFVAKISDFGLSVWKDYTSTMSSNNHPLHGTYAYVAPELFENSRIRVNEKTDIYSTGILIWEIFSMERPYPSSSLIPILVPKGQRPDLAVLPDDLPKAFHDIIETCWAQNPTARPSSSELKALVGQIWNTLESQILATKHRLLRRVYSDGQDSSSDGVFPVDLVTSSNNRPITVQSIGDSAPGVNHQLTSSVDTNPDVPKQPERLLSVSVAVADNQDGSFSNLSDGLHSSSGDDLPSNKTSRASTLPAYLSRRPTNIVAPQSRRQFPDSDQTGNEVTNISKYTESTAL